MDSSGRCISTGVHFLSFLPSAEGKQVFTGFHTFRTFVVRGLVLHTACLSSGPHLCMVKAYVFNFHEILCFHPHRGTEMTSLASSLHGGPFLSTFQGGSFILSPAFMQGSEFQCPAFIQSHVFCPEWI